MNEFGDKQSTIILLTVDPMFKEVNLKYIPNRRGGMNLAYNGFLYTVERKYKSTINWVCNKNSNTILRCPARCVTTDDRIRLSQKPHNHNALY